MIYAYDVSEGFKLKKTCKAFRCVNPNHAKEVPKVARIINTK